MDFKHTGYKGVGLACTRHGLVLDVCYADTDLKTYHARANDWIGKWRCYVGIGIWHGRFSGKTFSGEGELTGLGERLPYVLDYIVKKHTDKNEVKN